MLYCKLLKKNCSYRAYECNYVNKNVRSKEKKNKYFFKSLKKNDCFTYKYLPTTVHYNN